MMEALGRSAGSQLSFTFSHHPSLIQHSAYSQLSCTFSHTPSRLNDIRFHRNTKISKALEVAKMCI